MSDTIAPSAIQPWLETKSIPENLDEAIAKAPGKPSRTDADGFRAQLAAEVDAAEKELTRDQKALEAAIAKVDELKGFVAFDEMRVESRAKGLATFERLSTKAGK
jgi:hypothetical protein